ISVSASSWAIALMLLRISFVVRVGTAAETNWHAVSKLSRWHVSFMGYSLSPFLGVLCLAFLRAKQIPLFPRCKHSVAVVRCRAFRPRPPFGSRRPRQFQGDRVIPGPVENLAGCWRARGFLGYRQQPREFVSVIRSRARRLLNPARHSRAKFSTGGSTLASH